MIKNLGGNPTDQALLDARDSWTVESWDKHFKSLGLMPAGEARYSTKTLSVSPVVLVPHNDVIKLALFSIYKGRCWWKGTETCKSRAVLPSEAQIDHIIPHRAGAESLRKALGKSRYQRNYFDVHDPGNLAYICGPCNLEKGELYPDEPSMENHRRIAESNRDKVIDSVRKWYAQANIDVTGLSGVKSLNLNDADVFQMYTSMIADLLFNLGDSMKIEWKLPDYQETTLECGDFIFTIGPSGEACQSFHDALEEMKADDRRAERAERAEREE